MTFKDKYQLTDLLVGNSDAITFRALETFSGREVLVHLLHAETRVTAEALTAAGVEVMEFGRYREQSFIVTPAIAGFNTLSTLLDRQQDAPIEKEKTDFSRMFQTADPGEPGEFTRIFQGGGPSKQPSKQPTMPPAPSEPIKRAPSPAASEGEFTRLFHPPAPKQGSSWSPPPAKPAEPDWTPKLRWENGNTQSDAATGVFAPASEPRKPSQTVESGPSDFTRIISSPQKPAPPAEPQSVAASPSVESQIATQKPAAPSYMPLILILGGLFLLALLVVLYFAFL